ncbi:MAG: hypothetical protein HYU63_07930, partial [Armatimonadetes bacterium]|nr:hypothetical protein [Armatimonadota bacterium]
MKWLKTILFLLFLFSLISLFFIYLIAKPFSSENKIKIIEIKENTSASQTAKILEQNGIIRSAFIFKILLHLSKSGAKIKA